MGLFGLIKAHRNQHQVPLAFRRELRKALLHPQAVSGKRVLWGYHMFLNVFNANYFDRPYRQKCQGYRDWADDIGGVQAMLEKKKAGLTRLREELDALPPNTRRVDVWILVNMAIPRAEEEVWFFSNIEKMEAGFTLIDQLLYKKFGLDPRQVADFDYQVDYNPSMPGLSDVERLQRFRIAFQLLEILVMEHGYTLWGLTRQSFF
ncbi:MAG: hypothetical protein ABIA67_02785 [Candidatus Margulisiibacteriota bacterium]